MNKQIETVKIDSISPNPFQPRMDSFEEDQLQEMAKTIQQVGLLHPPVVRETEEGEYELIAGERRYRAAKLAGLKEIPVVIQKSDDKHSSLSALIENIQRVDLNPIELATAMKNLAANLNLTQEELSSYIGVKRSTIANHLRLLSLPREVQGAIKEKRLSTGHAKVILSLEKERDQLLLYQIVLRSNLNVRETEKKAESIKSKHFKIKKKNEENRNIFLEQIRDTLQNKMGTKVEFIGNAKKGVLQLHYYSLSDLNRLLHELGYSEE